MWRIAETISMDPVGRPDGSRLFSAHGALIFGVRTNGADNGHDRINVIDNFRRDDTDSITGGGSDLSSIP